MIQIANLTFGYRRNKPLYKNLNITLQEGSIYGLLGKNGAGKSTLLKNLVGLVFPTAGTISVNGYIPKMRLPSFLQTIYFIPEEVNVPSLTIKGYVKLYSPFYSLFNEDQFTTYLAQLEVNTDDKLSTLSFGQQKKFVIAFALACNTRVLLLDEPTNGLDIPSKIQFRRLMSSVVSHDRIILISTHQIRDLDNLIDSVIIIDRGQLLLNASITTIAEKLCFKTVPDLACQNRIFYSEESLKGFSVIMENTNRENSQVDLEQLFSSVTQNHETVESFSKN